jgi:hypothetical protein
LPKAPSDLHGARKGDLVTLTWTIPRLTSDRQRVRYLGKTNICRSLDAVLKQCEKVVGEAAPPADFVNGKKSANAKVTASFVDALPSAIEREHPEGFATYAIEVLNTANRGVGISNQVHVPLLPTLPPFAGFAAEVNDQGVMVTWRCPLSAGQGASGAKYLFRIYRRAEGGGETKIAEIDATSCAMGPRAIVPLPDQQPSPESTVPNPQDKIISSFLDQSFEWEKTYSYRGTVVSVLQTTGKPPTEVEGEDTPGVKVFAHDIFPPAVPSGLQAVYSGQGQQPFIDLIWAPVPDADLDGYNVYRHEGSATPVKLNSELIKAPAFRDTQVEAGKTYFYSVSAVDQRGNESGRSAEGSEKVP